MPRVRKQNHTHKLFKPGGKYTSLWKCALPDCRFFVYQAQENVLFGRKSLCWECSEEFIMDEYTMKDDMPKCMECMDKIEQGIPYKPPVNIEDIIPPAPPIRTSESDSPNEEEKKKLRTMLEKRIKLHKDIGFPTDELEEQLKNL